MYRPRSPRVPPAQVDSDLCSVQDLEGLHRDGPSGAVLARLHAATQTCAAHIEESARSGVVGGVSGVCVRVRRCSAFRTFVEVLSAFLRFNWAQD